MPRVMLLLLTGGLAGCQGPSAGSEAAAPPPVGHYEGTLTPTGRPATRAALDIRHPSPGHYEAELTVPDAPVLSFVADTILFANNALRLARPARPGQTLALRLDGDFWRGTLREDSAQAAALLVRRGPPTPRTYRVEELPQASGSAWLFAPADTRTAGPALALLPDAAAAPAAPAWADALAREGVVVLLLPADTAVVAALPAALRILRRTAGVDTASLGAWASGARARPLLRAAASGPAPAYVLLHQFGPSPTDRPLLRALAAAKVPVLGLPATAAQGAALRRALGGRRGTGVLAVPPAGRFPGQQPALVAQWLGQR